MRYAWIENETARDISDGDPTTLYHPEVAARYDTEAPDDARNGWGYVRGEWAPPPTPTEPPATSPAAAPPVVSAIRFKIRFKLQELITIKAARATNPVVDTLWELVEDQRITTIDMGLPFVQDGLRYLESQGLIGPGRADEIMRP